MKILIPIILALLMGCQTTKVKRAIAIVSPDVVTVKVPIERAKQTVTKAGERVTAARSAVSRSQVLVETIKPEPEQVAAVESIRMELASVEADLMGAQDQLTATNLSLLQATDRVDTLQGEVDKLRDVGIVEQLRADRAEENLARLQAEHKRTVAAYHRIKFYVAGLAALIAGALAFACTSFLINPLYRGLAALAAGALTFTLVWSIL